MLDAGCWPLACLTPQPMYAAVRSAFVVLATYAEYAVTISHRTVPYLACALVNVTCYPAGVSLAGCYLCPRASLPPAVAPFIMNGLGGEEAIAGCQTVYAMHRWRGSNPLCIDQSIRSVLLSYRSAQVSA